MLGSFSNPRLLMLASFELVVGIEVVPADQSKVVLFASIFQERFLTGGKVVSTDYLMSFRKKSVSQRAADKARCAGNENFHRAATCPRSFPASVSAACFSR